VVVIYALMVYVSCEWTDWVCLHVTAAVFNRDSELIFVLLTVIKMWL